MLGELVRLGVNESMAGNPCTDPIVSAAPRNFPWDCEELPREIGYVGSPHLSLVVGRPPVVAVLLRVAWNDFGAPCLPRCFDICLPSCRRLI